MTDANVTSIEDRQLMDLANVVDRAFELPRATQESLGTLAAGLSQLELDTQIAELKRERQPGLRHQIAEAWCSGDKERISEVFLSAREQAMVAFVLAQSRKEARAIMARNAKANF